MPGDCYTKWIGRCRAISSSVAKIIAMKTEEWHLLHYSHIVLYISIMDIFDLIYALIITVRIEFVL